MASKMGLIGCLIVVATVLVGATAQTHNVGDSLQWTVPPLGDIAYKTWAARQDFRVGDTVVFTWNGTHNVARVSKDDYDNCSSANTIGEIQTTSPTSFTIDNNGSQYYICTVDRHCALGQKVTITVGSSPASLITSALSSVFLAMAISIFSLM